MKPETHKGSGIPLNLYSGLLTGIMFGKASINLSDNPKLRNVFKPNILNKPSSVKCFPFLIKTKHCLNNKKSDILEVTRGYFSKWSMITCNSFLLFTL